MLQNLTMKQKIILGIVLGGMIVVIGIYGVMSLKTEEELDITNLIENSELLDQNIRK